MSAAAAVALEPIHVESRRRREQSTVHWLACPAIRVGEELRPDPQGREWMFFADEVQADRTLYRFGFFAERGGLSI